MTLDDLISSAREQGASDLHLEPGLPPAVRVRGSLRVSGEPLGGRALLDMAREIIGQDQWPRFLERRSFDLSKNIAGVRCRINVLQTARGVGLAVRLLASFQATVETLNLHPDLKKLVAHQNGLILVSGPTGCGKSSTMAALIQEINLTEPRHIVTIESPVEYTFRPRHAYIRQREVGRDTPSFDQALLDALREDPDVLMVGEMRDPETMRLTLNAAETGHLVLATIHSSNCVEALQRLVSAFPAEIQNSVRAQLADCLLGVIAQRLRFRSDLNIRVPECEILMSTHPVRNFIRTGEFFRIAAVIETGAEHGMWTYARYQNWIENRKNWHLPARNEGPPDADVNERAAVEPARPAASEPKQPSNAPLRPRPPQTPQESGGPIEIEPVEGGLSELIRKLEKE